MKQFYLYVDPACPWSWLTVRWLTGVATERNLQLTFRSFSLWKRDGEEQAPGLPPFIRDLAIATSKQSLRLLRVFEALRADGRADAIGPLYLAWGKRVFTPGLPSAPGPAVVEEVIAETGLEGSLSAAADDTSWDAAIEATMSELSALSDTTPLVPTLVGPSATFTGAIISAPVSPGSGLRLWDTIETLTAEPAFAALTPPRLPMPVFV